MTDDNVVHLYPDLVPDLDEDGDGFSDSAEMVIYDPPLPASILDSTIVPRRDVTRDVLDRCRGALEYRWYAIRFHTVRSPAYAFRYTTHAGAGAWKVTSRVWHWTHDTEGLILRTQASLDPNLTADAKIRAHQAAHEARVLKVRWRRGFVLVAALFLILVIRWGVHAHPWWSLLAGLATAVCLGMVGAQRHEVIPYIESPLEDPLSIDLLVEGFIDAAITKPDRPIQVSSPPYDTGRGWVARVKLPGGVTFDNVIAKQVDLASGLDRPRDCLAIDGLQKESERLIEVFVAHQHPMDVEIPPWPLLNVDRWDIWRPIPVGWDIRGNEVHLSLLWVMTLVGAAMQRGKTSLMRLLALGALLDPRVDLILVDFKGGLDWVPYEKYCRKFLKGPRQVPAFYDLLDELDAEYERRMAAISLMSPADVPQGRVTPAMAETKAFRPIVVIVDEMQIATEYVDPSDEKKEDKLDGKKIAKKWAELLKVCPAAGITFVMATQKPDDTSVPTYLRDAALQRLALSVATRHASVAITGDEAYKVGLNAAALGGMPGYGIAWAQDSEAGSGYRGRLRIPNCTPEMASVMLERVGRVRSTVTVEAVEDIPERRPQTPQIVADVLRVWPSGEVVAHLHDLAEALGRTRAEVSGPLRKLGLAPNQNLKIRGVNRSGYDLIDIQNLASSDPP